MTLIDSWLEHKEPGSTGSQSFTVPRALPTGTVIFAAVIVGAATAVLSATDTRGNTWSASNSFQQSGCGTGALMRCRLTTALQAGDTVTIASTVNTTRYAAVFGAFDDVVFPLNSINATGEGGTVASHVLGPTAVDVQAYTLVVMSVASTGGGYPYTGTGGLGKVGETVTTGGSSDRGTGLFYRYEANPSDQYTGTVNLSGSAASLALLTAYEAVEPEPPEETDIPFSIWKGGVEVPVTSAAIWKGGVEVPLTTAEIT